MIPLLLLLAAAAPPVSEEALRLTALRTIFPGMRISVERGKRIDNSYPKDAKPGEPFFGDALASEAVYLIIGPPMNRVERCACGEDMGIKISHARQVRFKLFH